MLRHVHRKLHHGILFHRRLGGSRIGRGNGRCSGGSSGRVAGVAVALVAVVVTVEVVVK